MTVIRLADLPRTPWKNGLGSRAAIAAGDGWSLSHAWIDEAAPFSDFAGWDRTCVLLAGAGLSLSVDSHPPVELARPGAAAAFSGDARVEGRPWGESCHVVNVMTERARFVHTVHVVTHLPASGYAVVIRGEASLGGRPIGTGDTLVLPCDVELSSDFLALSVTVTAR